MDYIHLEKITRNAIPLYDLLSEWSWKKFELYDKRYSNQDYRCAFFGTFCEIVLWILVQLENFSNHNPDLIIQKRFSKLQDSSRAQILLQIDNINRQSFVTAIMFLIEDFINQILLALGRKPEIPYKNNIKTITKLLFEGSFQKFNILYSPYLIRNSLHNNGYIKILNDEFDLEIGEKTYQFKKDIQITFAGWDNLFILTDEILKIIIEIIENKNIESIYVTTRNTSHCYCCLNLRSYQYLDNQKTLF